MTLQQAARQAIDVQNACNLSGVVRSFVEVIDAIRATDNRGTDYVNRHPIAVLFASKIADLTRCEYESGDVFSRAYADCKVLATEQSS